jgi:hypothetical protein
MGLTSWPEEKEDEEEKVGTGKSISVLSLKQSKLDYTVQVARYLNAN